MLAVAVLALVLGLAIGSFLNVVAYRLPRGESLSHPPSACPSCGTPIKPYDNVPVLGWLWLRGRCRACRATISPRYPIVEAVTGLLWFAVVLVLWDDVTDVVLGLVLVTALVPLTLIDLDVRLLPNTLTYPTAVLGIVLVAALDIGSLPERLAAGAGAFLFFLIAALVNPKGMGMGDVKLAFVLGIYLGRAVAPAVFVALLAGVAFGIAVMAIRGVAAGRKTAVPFGPFLALGALVALFVGDDLVDAYTDSF